YTSVYTDSEPGRAFWGADNEEVSEGGIPQAQDPDYVPEPIYPEYIPLVDEHEFLAKEKPILPVDSPTAEDNGDDDDGDSSGDDADEDEDDEDKDDEDDEDEDDKEEEEEHIASADSTIVAPVDEPVFPPERTKPVIPPPSTDITIG
ncbi:hypothetical protein Tco_0248899, partial [Tanacetum coccineum]